MAGVLALVPARGGSKGIPGKNIRPLAGHTLIDYVARVVRDCGAIDRAILSTDAADIAAEGRRVGLEVPFLRPAPLAGDDTPMLPVIEHAVAALESSGWSPDIVVLLQPTAPLRRPDHVRRALALLRDGRSDAVASVVALPPHLSPDYVMRIENGGLVPFLPEGARTTRRQQARPAYVRDGTVYAFWTRTLRDHHSIYGERCAPLLIPAAESITLDSEEDWAEAERRLIAESPAG